MEIRYPENLYQAVYSKYLAYRAARAAAKNSLPVWWIFFGTMRLIAYGVVVCIAFRYALWIVINLTNIHLKFGQFVLNDAVSALLFLIIVTALALGIMNAVYLEVRNSLYPEYIKTDAYDEALHKVHDLLPYFAYVAELKSLSEKQSATIQIQIERKFNEKADICVNDDVTIITELDGVAKKYHIEKDMYSFENDNVLDLSVLDSKLSEIESACPITIKFEEPAEA